MIIKIAEGKRKVFLLVILYLAVIGLSWLFAELNPDLPGKLNFWADRQTPALSQLDGPRAAGANWPLLFILNQGQVDRRVLFYVQGKDKNVYFRADGLTITLATNRKQMKTELKNSLEQPVLAGGLRQSPDLYFLPQRASLPERIQRWTVQLDFVGACPEARVEGRNQAETRVSYFRGRPENWLSGIPTYQGIIYHQLWPGVDLTFSGDQNAVKYEFVVTPGAQPESIKLSYQGASEIKLNNLGQLEVMTPAGSFVDETPEAYQIKEGKRISIPVSYEILEKEASANGLVSCLYAFKVGDYDRSQPLFIDPAVLVYSGYVGGSSNDRALAIALDSSGSVYITGWTGSIDFPVQVGPDLTFNGPSLGTDAFVAKVNPSGSGLIYCGFLGGSFDDGGTGIAVDNDGNAYVVGYTKSPDFPTYLGPYTSPAANITQYSDGFITKIDASGTGLLYSGYLGGTSTDLVNSVALDSSGRAYVCGTTESSNFPTKTGPDTTHNGQQDAFVARVAASGASLDWSGFIGGTNDDVGSWIALDSSGNAYVVGYTSSTPGNQFPVKNGPGLTHKGGKDSFVAKVSSTGSSLVYCGYIGGNSDDYGAGIAVDTGGYAYVTGATMSAGGFPVVGGPDISYNGGSDAFVAKVNQTGTELVFCGFLGGSSNDFGLSIAVDSQGISYVAGATDSSNFPVTGGPYSSYSGDRDAFVTVIRPDGLGFYYSSFLGGSDWEEANGLAADGYGNYYLAGFTRSQNFPVLVGPFQQPGGGVGFLTEDAFVTRIYGLLPPAAPANLRMTAVSQNSASLAWDDKSPNEDGFKIERKTGASGTWTQVAAVGANVTAYQNIGLSEATNYFYRVKAYNSAGDSDYSNVLSVLTLPAAPTGLAATIINERRINLSWTDNSNGETGFRVERKTGGGSWVTLTQVAANTVSYGDTSVRENTTYTYRVFAYNDSGDSGASNEATVTTPDLTVPVAPSGLQAVALSATRVALTWVDNSYNEDGFKIERKTGAGGTWGQVGTVGEGITTFTDGGLSELTTYNYRVKAYNNAGDSDYSNEVSVTTPENKPKLRVPVGEVIFDRVNVCDYKDMTTVIYNDGGADLVVTGVSRASGSNDFSYQAPALPFNVGPFSSRTITIRFAPKDVGAASAVFNLDSNDPDNPSASFNANGVGFIPVITISVEAERLTEKAWIIRRDYGRLTVVVNKEAPYAVAKYRLLRRAVGASYELRKEFSEAEFSYGRLVYIDKYLDKGKSYLYKMEALDCTGRVIASSDEVSPESTSSLEKINSKPKKIIR